MKARKKEIYTCVICEEAMEGAPNFAILSGSMPTFCSTDHMQQYIEEKKK
jgi:hypothetical protein